MSRIALLLSRLFVVASRPLPPQEASSADRDRLLLLSAAYLINAAIGRTIAIHDDLPLELFGLRTGWSAREDFFVLGTALSPGLPMLLSHATLTALAAQPGRTGRRATTGLVTLAAGELIGAAGEAITHRALRGQEPPERTLVVAGNLVLPAFMLYSGVRALQLH